MSKFITLTRVLLKNTRQTQKKGKLPKTLMFFILMALCFAPLVSGLVFFISKAYDVAAPIQQEGIIISLGVSVMCIVIFFFGIFFVINTFYFSKDVETLLPLPLRASHILGAKFSVVIIYEYITQLIILAPIIIVYGIKSSADIIYYIYGAIVFLVMPVVPIVLDSFLAIGIMRVTNIGAHKERFKTIGGVIALCVGIGINVFMQRFQRASMGEQDIAAMLQQGNNSLVKFASGIFPGSSFATESLVRSGELQGLWYLLAFLATALVLVTIFMLLGEKLYFKGVVGVSEAPSKRKKLTSEEFEKTTVKGSSLSAYTVKELRLLFRTSVYFMNCVLMNFIWPLAFIPALIQNDTKTLLKTLSTSLKNGSGYTTALLGGLGIILFTSVANATAPTSISREGTNIFISKYLPISYKKQILAKVMSSFVLNTIGLLVLLVTSAVVIKPPIWLMLVIILVGITVIAFTGLSGVLIDLNFPKLHWENEQKAVKQNMNVLANMAVGAAVGFLIGYLVVKTGLGFWGAFWVLLGIFSVLDIVLYYVLSTWGVKLFSQIEG